MTTTTRLTGLGLALLLAACSGGGDAPSNAAANATFTYATPTTATSGQAGALGPTMATLDAFEASPSASNGLAAADGAVISGELLTGSGIPSFSPGATGGGIDVSVFQVPSCATVTASQVTFNGCTVAVDETSGSSTTRGTFTVNGRVTAAADGKGLDWDLHYGVNLTLASSSSSMRMTGGLHASGAVAVTATTAVGNMKQEVRITVSANGQSISAGVDESLAFDVTRASTCASGVTGGTLEAKRVWTARPSGADLPDEALKVTWTGCGEATVQVGHR